MKPLKLKMNEMLVAGIIFLVIVAGGIFFYGKFSYPEVLADFGAKENGSYVEMPRVSESADYGKDFKVYESGLGFSFKYPPHLIVEALQKLDSETTDRIVLRPKFSKDDGLTSAIIISVAENDEKMTAEEWFLGPDSGFDHSGEYHKTTVGKQDAVFTEGGMWVVLNIPDNKRRLSIAGLTIGEAEILFTEMGILVDSLEFKP